MPGSNSGVSINFTARGNDLLSFMDRIRERAGSLTNTMLENARRQSSSARDQIRYIEEEIKALERKNRIEAEAARQHAAQQRDARRDQNRQNADARAAQIEDDYAAGRITRSRRNAGLQSVDDTLQRENASADTDYRDQLQVIRDQEREEALQTRLLRDNIETVRTSAAQQIRQIRNGDESLIDAIDENQDPLERLANQAASEQFRDENDDKDKDKDKNGGESTFSALLKSLALDRGLGLLSQIPSARNELDFVKPIMSMVGMTLGGITGNLIDMANVKILGTGAGNSNWAGLGMQLGEKAGEFFGTALERSYRSRDELTTRNFRLQAMTGRDMGIDAIGGANGLAGTGLSSVVADLKEYGLDFKETADLMYKAATARGYGGTMGRDVEQIAALQAGLGVQEQTTLSLMELQRSSRDQNRDVARLVGGIASAGRNNIFAGDRTFLNEFLQKNYIGLQKELLKGQDSVASGTTFDILRRFDALGGQFAARDPRSLGLISQVNNSLVNPGSDNLKALSFIAMRNANPSAGISQLLEEQQKGLASPTYLKSMLGMIDRLGGDDDMKIMNVAGAFGLQNNIAAARRLYRNRAQLMNGSISMAELNAQGEYGEDALKKLGQDQTSKYSKSTAEIENAFIKDVAGAVNLVGEKMASLFGDMTDQLKAWIIKRLSGDEGIKQNTTAAPLARPEGITRGGSNAVWVR